MTDNKSLSEKIRDTVFLEEGKASAIFVSDVREAVKKLKEEPYALMCNCCFTILETPCFPIINGEQVCKNCNCKSLEPLYTGFQINAKVGKELCE